MPITQVLLTAGNNEPTYIITPAANNVDEGSSLTFTVSGTNITNGTYYWTTPNEEELTEYDGSFTITDNSGSFTVTALADSLTEGNHTFSVYVRSDSTAGTILATSESITINDTSLTAPTYTLTPAANNIDEGSSLTFTVGGTNIIDGTYYWTIETNSGDFATTDGTVSVASNSGTFSVTPAADATTEVSAETFTVALRSTGINGTILVTSDPVTINDTSQTGPLTAYVTGWNNVSDWLAPDVAGNPDLTPVVAGWTVTGPLDFTATVVGSPFSNGTNWIIPVDASLAGFTSSNQGNYTFTPPP